LCLCRAQNHSKIAHITQRSLLADAAARSVIFVINENKNRTPKAGSAERRVNVKYT